MGVCERGKKSRKSGNGSGRRESEIPGKVIELVLCFLVVCLSAACIMFACMCVVCGVRANVIILAQRQRGIKFHDVWCTHEFIPS